jgi:hypothetical protein
MFSNKQITLSFLEPERANFRFSGHETFPCRYAWLPKAFLALEENATLFSVEEDAMVKLGVGKNMVRAIRFWVQVAGIAAPAKSGGLKVTDFGRAILSKNGFDPFLEDVRTLWLLHWKLSSHMNEPLFAWNYLLNYWHHPEISRTEVLEIFEKKAEQLGRKLSPVTLEQHFDVFLHTYVPTRSRKGEIQEDNLDCPLVELQLIVKTGERTVDDTGKRETIYAFRWEDKPEITPELFAYCLNEYWRMKFPHEEEISFRDVAFMPGSPGQIFKIPEWDVRRRLDDFNKDSKATFSYVESAALPRIKKVVDFEHDFLTLIYKPKAAYA